jgi:hypothetical protein
MSTRREQILAAIKTALDDIDDVTVYRSRTQAAKREEGNVVNVFPIADAAEQANLGRLGWSLVVRVSATVFADDDDVLDTAADPIVEAIHAAMTADPFLGGLSVDVQPVSTAFQFPDSDQSLVVGSDFRVLYQTALKDLSAL